MFNYDKTQKSILTFKSKKNASRMLGGSKKLREAEANESEQKYLVKSKGKTHGLRSKHILKKYSSKRIPGQNPSAEFENEVENKRIKSARKTKTSNATKLAAAERKPFQKNFFLPYLEESFRRQSQSECSSKDISHTKLPEVTIAGDTNNMIFVSLDFIEDCQKYKKKFMKPPSGQEFKNSRKSSEAISKRHSNHKKLTRIPRKEEKTYKRVLCENSSETKIVESSPPNETEENCRETKTNSSPAEDSEDVREAVAVTEPNEKPLNEPLTDELVSQCDKASTETFLIKQSSNVKPTSEDVSTVDKKYIEFLLSIANCNEKKQKTNVKKHEPKTDHDDGSRQLKQPKKKVISGKTFFENKINKEKEEEKRLNDTKEKEQIISETPKKSVEENSNVYTSSQRNTFFSRLVRDLTKSEVQIQRQKRKKTCGDRLIETQSQKKTAHSKPEVNDNRKKRKTRNNVLKKNNEEISEMPSPREISNAADVKELWRRGTRKKSENSLSSHSASTVQQSDEIPESKNSELESYQILRKIVEEEIKTICKNFVDEKNDNQKTNLNEYDNNKMECAEESNEVKNVCKGLREIISENGGKIFDTKETKADADINSSVLDEQQNLILNCEEEKKRNSLLSFIDKYDSKNLSHLLEKKIPSEVVKNWSILRRLEKAFLALGTPTFPNATVKESNTLKTTNPTKKSGEHAGKIREADNNQKNKKLQKSKDLHDTKENKCASTLSSKYLKPPKSPGHTVSSNVSPPKTALQSVRNEKAKSESKELIKKKKPQGVQNPRLGRQPGSAVNSHKASEGDNKLKLTKGKLQNQKVNITDAKTTPKSSAKTKTREYESQYSKRNIKQKNSKPQSAGKTPTSDVRSKDNEEKDAKSSQPKTQKAVTEEIKNEKQNVGENLERKETYVLPLDNSYIIQPQKSQSCQKVSTNPIESREIFEIDFSFIPGNNSTKSNQTKTINMKLVDSSSSSPSDKIPPRQERPKTANDKYCLIKNQESSMKLTRNHIPQSCKLVTETSGEDTQPQILAERYSGSDKDRIVKERSILSMRNDKMQRKSLTHLPENTYYLQLKKPVENFSKYSTKNLDILLDIFTENSPESLSYTCASTSTFDIEDFHIQNKTSLSGSKIEFKSLRSMKYCELSKESTSLSSMSTSTLEQQQSATENKMKTVKNQKIWEQDIKQYRAIVKDIMNHYKRIDGLLKENEHSRVLPYNSTINLTSKDKENPEFNRNSKNFLEMNIHEYRKKILSEYESLSIFEYKKKMQEQEANDKTREKRRNLSFVKALETEMDLDVKDFQPNIQKILDSQLYVDTQNLYKRKEPCVKFCEKKSSLQDIALNKNQKLMAEECPRSAFTPKNSSLVAGTVGYHSTSALNVSASVHSDVGIQTLLLKI